MTDNNTTTARILDALELRAKELGDKFERKPRSPPDKVRVRRFRSEQHKNGDDNPSALYSLGNKCNCKVCIFKTGSAS